MGYLGIEPGPMVGEIMKMLLERRIEDGPYGPEDGYAMVRQFAIDRGLGDPGPPPEGGETRPGPLGRRSPRLTRRAGLALPWWRHAPAHRRGRDGHERHPGASTTLTDTNHGGTDHADGYLPTHTVDPTSETPTTTGHGGRCRDRGDR